MNKTQLKEIIREVLQDEIQLLDVLNSGDVQSIKSGDLELVGTGDVGDAIDRKENKMYNPPLENLFFTSSVGGQRSWAVPVSQWGDIQGNITAQNDLMLEFLKKEDDLGNPAEDGMILSSHSGGARAWVTNQTLWGEIEGILSSQTDLVVEFLKHFQKTEHVEESAGAQDHGKPVVLNDQGKLDQSMVVSVEFNPRGEFTPEAGAEYPDEAGSEPLDVWRIGGLAGSGYEYTGGTLDGKTAFNDNILLYVGDSQWSLLAFDGDTSEFYLLDGTRALTGALNAGNQKLSLVADGTADSDVATVGQLYTHEDDDENPHGVTKAQVELAYVIDTGDGTNYLSDDGTYKLIEGGGGTWGSIIGDIEDQTDLQAELDLKVNNNYGFDNVTALTSLTQEEYDGAVINESVLYVIPKED